MQNDIEKLVLDNIDLIQKGYSFYKSKVSTHHRDELMSLSNYSLFKTAKSYDESRGCKFNTLFFKILRNEIRKFYRDRNASTRMSIYGEDISLSQKIDSGDDMDFESCIMSRNNDIDSNLLLNETLKSLLDNLGERELLVLKLRFNNPNLTYAELGEKLGVTNATICRVIKSIKIKYHLLNNGILFKKCPDKLLFIDYKDIIRNYDYKINEMIYL